MAGRMSKHSIADEAVDDIQHSGNNNLHTEVLLDNIYACIQEVKRINVNDANVKGEIPLHLAAKNKSPQGHRMLEILIAEGSDVNARNKWHQTPLHYAAVANSVDNIVALIRVPDIDVNAKDVKGYNPLQAMLSAGDGGRSEDDNSYSQVSLDLKKAICILVQTGTNINNQTQYGHSILHLAAVREDNTPLLEFLILEFTKNFDLSLKDKMGDNFLHVYATFEIFEEILELFSTIAEQNLATLKELLAEQNVMGRTPWELMIDDVNASDEAVEQILGYGVSFSRSDNLGNTTLHRIAGVLTGTVFCEVLHALIKGGACVNSTNIYGESAVSLLFEKPVLEVFLKYELTCNTLDRWGRSPLVSVMKHHPNPDLLRTLIEKGHADVNTKDMFGSTPLHFAAYHNYPEQVKMLLAHGADINARDNLKDRPLDTVRRHCSFRCNEILQKAENPNVTVLYTRKKTFADTLLDLPKKIKSSKIQTRESVQRILRPPTDLEQFMDNLIETYFHRSHEHSNEIAEVEREINKLVNSLCLQMVQYDSTFEMSIFPTGSSAEGMKVGPPDEFDFVLCLDRLNALTDIVMTKACQETGFVCLKFKDIPVNEEYLPFSDMDGYFLAFPFLQYFQRYLRRALNETHLWESGQLYFNFEDRMEVIKGKPVFNFNVYWVGSIYKQLKISIDLVPAVYKRGWWPPNINVAKIPLMTEDIRNEGCFLILQTQSNDFDANRHVMEDCLSKTCNNDRDEQDCIKQRMLRVSAAPAEICLVKSMPTKFRHAYALAKIVKGTEVCPEIEIDELPTQMLSHQKKFQKNTSNFPLQPSHLIKSYMLKNCTFYIFEKNQLRLPEERLGLKTIQITSNIYENLLEYADEQNLNPYFLPYSDVFEFESFSNERSSYDNFMLRLKRELSIKLVLGILNHPFSSECLASRLWRH